MLLWNGPFALAPYGGFTHIVDEYAKAILTDEIPACRWVKLACHRHLEDRVHGYERGLYFDEDAADQVLDFFGFLHHSKGEWAGSTFELEPWEMFIAGAIFGWKRSDGFRRFRTIYVEVARKNGKSTLLAGIALYLFIADGEPGAEVYTAAPLALDTKVPTVDGYTTMGEIKVGDRVFDENGDPCTVEYVAPILHGRKCYEVAFNDGTKIIADSEHRWRTGVCCSGRSLKGRKREDFFKTRTGARTFSVFTTEEIKDSLYYQGRKNHLIPVAGRLNTPARKLPIPPYTLGAWLGDGRNNRGAIVSHPEDMGISENIKKDGFKISQHGKNGGLYRFTPLGLRTLLRKNNLLENKHIPIGYLRASYDQRLALLQGLMDTDGTCSKTGECRFANRNYTLASGVYELACTLGFRANLKETSVTNKPHYIVSFKTSTTVFRLERKNERQVYRDDARVRNRYIESITEVPSVPVRCISVSSPSNLFLITGSLIATHNTKRDQAIIVHSEASRMVKASPALRKRIGIFKNNLSIDSNAAKFEPLGADSDSMDGLNVHAAVVDELHAHKTRGTWDVLETATGSRRQPMLFAITTAGFDQNGICYEQRDYVTSLLKGTIEDDSYFGIIYTLDLKKEWPDLKVDDDWTDPENWIKSNPNLGISVKVDDIERLALKAKAAPAAQNNFLTKRLNVWTQQVTRWIDLEAWDNNFTGEVYCLAS